jgi:nitroimidazol reductase NimA-like FMN-containing flavoprotein (pyridoxamine 5'-phosphate oxidase superfamily)
MTDLLLTDRPFQPDVNNAVVSNTRRSAALPVDAPSTYPFPRDTEESLHWEEVDAQLRENRIYWLATVRPDGRPHLAPIWGTWVEDAFYFQGAPTSRWARNLAETPLASIHLESAIDVVIVDGEIEFVQTEPELAEVLIDAWQTKYGNMIPAPETRGLYRLRARTVVAWGATLQDAARWRFEES